MQEETQPDYPETLIAPVTKLTDWKIEPDVAKLKTDIEQATPYQRTHLDKVNRWNDNLHITGSAKITVRKGRSSVQPRLIRKQAEWRYTSLSEPFLSSDRLFQVSPRTFADAKAAKQAGMLLNWQMDTCLQKVNFIDQFVRTAVDEGTVILQLGWIVETGEEEFEVPIWGYQQIPEGPEAQQLLEMSQAESEIQKQLPADVQESIRYSTEAGIPHMAMQTGVRKEKREVTLKNYPTMEVAEIRNLVVDPTCGSDYTKARFIGYSMELSRAEMEADGRFKNLDSINWAEASILSQPDHTTKGPQDFNFKDKARAGKVVQFYWGQYDITGDGTLTAILTAWIGDVMVRCEKNPFPDKLPPFVIIPLLPIKKSFYGEPDGELLEENQKIAGAVTRGMIDLMARSANAQRGMAKNMLDPVNRRRFDGGEDYEFNPNVHPSNGIVEHKFPEIPQSAPLMLQMVNSESESLTGVKMFADQGLSGASLGPTAAGARGMLDASSRREMGILRRLAAGLALAGSKIAAMNQAFLSKEEVIRVTDEDFVEVRQEDLKGNYDLKVDIATADEDEARASRLEFMLQTLGPNAQPEMRDLLLAEIATLRRMPELAHKIQNFKPAPDPVQEQLKQLEIEKLQSEIAKNNADAARENAHAELYTAQAEAVRSGKDLDDLEFVEQETGTKHARDLEKIGAQAKANAKAKITEGILNSSNGRGPDGKVDTSPQPEDIQAAHEFNQQPLS